MGTAQLNNQKGFTLIELLVVIGILAILLAITLIAINPAKQFGNSNDTTRRADVNAILNSINQYMADHAGALPPNMPAAGATLNIQSGVGNADICASISPLYIANVPSDPIVGSPTGQVTNCGAAYNTGYTVSVSATNNRITVTSPAVNTYSGVAISATR